MSEQLGFNFEGGSGAVSSLAVWREERKAQIDLLARRSGLPIGCAARVRLSSGVLVEGKLLLATDEIWVDQRRSVELRLQIGQVDFGVREIESCVRLD